MLARFRVRWVLVYTEIAMLKNITFSAEEQIIEAARARAEKTTLNEKVRSWLENYARNQAESNSVLDRHLQTMLKARQPQNLT
ncbi:MAG TPA: hypothetical protein VEK14_02495 [Rhodomicrobium sp.]|nr:hypothetical protein [Rhodomicrobium sp.]